MGNLSDEEWDELVFNTRFVLEELVSQVSELSTLVAELTSLSFEQSKGVVIAESEYAFISQRLLGQQARLSMLLSNLSPKGGVEKD